MKPLIVPVTGLIPTHAGKTHPHALEPMDRAAHPHSRGENSHSHMRMNRSLGSSPLTRGKLISYSYYLGVRGLIPTHAGKTLTFRSIVGWCWAHPHSRGENSHTSYTLPSEKGSSPLTRGKPSGDRQERYRVRLIPTHAGKTHFSSLSVCQTGSSPLTRGKRHRFEVARERSRLIPTHAGKTKLPT